jgi:DNA gyrase subunit B
MSAQQDYDASQITVLEGLEPVRLRPGMYIGSTDIRGLHHLVAEIVDNAIDESLAGHCHNITIRVKPDSWVEVNDDGRGIPVDVHAKTGKSALETVFTVLHAWGKFEKSAYKISGGLHGVGASVVNALSEHLIVHVHKNGKLYEQSYHRWVPDSDTQCIGETELNGTTVSWKADALIFETTNYVFSSIVTKYRQTAYLTPGVTFTVINELTGERHRFYFEWGIKTWLGTMLDGQDVLTPIYTVSLDTEELGADIVFSYTDSANSNILSFVNNIPTPDGGTHLTWFRSALLNIINEWAKEFELVDKKVWEFQASDISDGLYAIVTVKVPNPEFEWQTKGRLGNSYVRKLVEERSYNYFKEYFASHQDEFKKLISKIALTARARMAAKLAKDTVLRKSPLGTSVLPGKLTDCRTKDKTRSELYLVEGDSAGGSAKQGRDAEFQAILPLKGKILNTEQAFIQKILANDEVKNLIAGIGAGLKDSFDLEKRRYDKIIIMTDADVDGSHIRTLLLTFFFRYMRPLVDAGHVYIAVPPLYKLTQGKRSEYIYNPPAGKSLDDIAVDAWFDLGKFEPQRYKWLGEMNPEQLWETTMNPDNRYLWQVTIEDAENTDRLFRTLMGEDVAVRKHFILENAKNVRDLDV